MARKHLLCGWLTRKQLVSPIHSGSADILTRTAALFCSKEGAAQVRLKIGLVGDDNGHNFTFTSSPQSTAYTERETFKREITTILSRNRTVADANIRTPSAAPTPAAVSNAPTPRPHGVSRNSSSRAPSVSSDGKTPIIPGSDPTSDFRLRKKVLMSNPELGTLHRDLVMSGQITESEFWEGREVSIREFSPHPVILLTLA